MKILVIQGPNLNLLGSREAPIYGTTTLAGIHEMLTREAGPLGAELEFFQSNHEGAILDRIHNARADKTEGILINAAALTHTSIGLADALKGVGLPYVEVHISNVHAREEFRHFSYISAGASGIVVGFGVDGYRLGLIGLVSRLKSKN